MNIAKMMQQAKEMQGKMEEMQAKMGDVEVQGESGGGLVKVTMTCKGCLLYTSPSPRDQRGSRMPSSA